VKFGKELDCNIVRN